MSRTNYFRKRHEGGKNYSQSAAKDDNFCRWKPVVVNGHALHSMPNDDSGRSYKLGGDLDAFYPDQSLSSLCFFFTIYTRDHSFSSERRGRSSGYVLLLKVFADPNVMWIVWFLGIRSVPHSACPSNNTGYILPDWYPTADTYKGARIWFFPWERGKSSDSTIKATRTRLVECDHTCGTKASRAVKGDKKSHTRH